MVKQKILIESTMINLFTQDELKLLLERQGATCGCVSLYMPTARAGTDIQQGPARLKNLIRQIKALMINRGIRSPEADKLLAPLSELTENVFSGRARVMGWRYFLRKISSNITDYLILSKK